MFDRRFHERQRINAISAGKRKKEKLTELALLYCKAKWRLFMIATTPCDGFATVLTFDDVMSPSKSLFYLRLYFWWFWRDSLHVTPQASSTIRKISCNAKQLNVQLERLMFYKDVCTLYHSTLRCTIRHYAEPFHTTLHHLCVRCTNRHYAEPFHATLHCFNVRCSIRHYAQPFHATLHHLCVRRTIPHYAELFNATLHHLYVRCTIRHYAELFHATLHGLCASCATRHYPEPLPATLHRLCTILQMNTKLFVIKLVNFMISCSNSTWATRPFIIG